ncbi:hypothetical protein M0811_05952 [Anaeramoeba ignava]|uniref:TLDc domain-containing protein n=1 Tax=Anaeramoeba ignava TaxID=1746090 RepID=A0A9Q0RG65_ANAIG|nr:hypothetical protein M0811_05952 [Anaeramoeba ignava]
MKKGFSAKKDGFDCKIWHDKCDNKGKTLVIIKTKDNFIFGGFTEVGFTTDQSKWSTKWRDPDRGMITDPNSFIFSLRNDKNDRKPEKFTIRKGEQSNAIFYYYSSYGPSFGFIDSPGDFRLYNDLQLGYSNFGRSYNLPNGIKQRTNEAKSYLAGSYKSSKVDEVETYFL